MTYIEHISIKLLAAMMSNPNIKEQDYKHNALVAWQNAEALCDVITENRKAQAAKAAAEADKPKPTSWWRKK